MERVRHVWDEASGEFVPEKKIAAIRFYEWLAAWPMINKLAAAAAVLRLIQIGQAAFWYDEGVTAVISQLPFKQMIAATAGDVHPPFYYALIWLLARIVPITEFTARLPSAAFSVAAIYLAAVLARRLDLTPRGQIALLIWVAISPLQLHYAQEARMYALLQLEVLAAIVMMMERRKTFLSVFLVLILYTHNYGVFYVPALAMACLAWLYFNCVKDNYPGKVQQLARHFARRWLIYFVVPVLLWLPWLAVLLGQMRTISGGYWIQPVTLPGVLYVFYQLLFAYSMPAVFQAIGVVLTFCILIYSGWRIYQDRPRYWQLLIVLIFSPLAMAIVASLLWRPLLLFRGLIGTAVPLTILAVKMIEGIKTPYKKYYAYAVIAVTLLAGVAGHYVNNVNNKGETVTWIHQIKDQFVNGDVIVALNDNGVIAAMTYAPELPLYKLEGCGADPLGSLSPATREALGVEEKSIDDLLANKILPKKSYVRVIFISTIAPVSPPCEIALADQLINGGRYRVKQLLQLADNEYAQAGVYMITSKEVY